MSPRKDVEAAVDMLIERLDRAAGDPDLEDSEGGNCVDERGRYLGGIAPASQDEDREPDDDAQGDVSWPEWESRGRHKLTATGAEAATHTAAGWQHEEDDEDDDPLEANGDERDENGDEKDSNNAEDEALSFANTGWDCGGRGIMAPGCPISDPGEREQMLQDVPMLPVRSLDHNLFTDERVDLGIGNLMSSFRTNGENVRSADRGESHRLRGDAPFVPGAPV